ncbi:hypothetical protein CHS0354_040126 [Potamilus streckersoni]|uniref:PPC domain-containing protein n=1 Tax=Potamilus streckersoni TaxID=2493646 RepID=A0AAE0SST0_9BIVA|nr:hypothetical protein CHS0354_040126 [Potamilus streckersoni]
MSSNVALAECYALRLKPGEELRTSLLKFVTEKGLTAAFVVSCVGSVTMATLRMANSTSVQTLDGPFEIVSLVGTLSGGGHLHASLSDKNGTVVGGHVVGDFLIYTTAEVVIGNCPNVQFSREIDKDTGYDELVVTTPKF